MSRKALVVGINAYPSPATLSGCVADALAWSQYLTRRKFGVKLLTDSGATRRAMLDALRALVLTAAVGDVLAFVYSGHGTFVPDIDGDEGDGADEALVPVDYRNGAFITDDDLRAVIDELPPGVTLTCILDCCYSGTATRLLGINAPRHGLAGRARYLPPSPEQFAAHELYRRAATRNGEFVASRPVLGPEDMRHATLSACTPQEVAYESNGMGDFTRAALSVLEGAGATLTLGGLLQRVLAVMGPDRWQTPTLDGPAAMLRRTLVRRARV